VSASNRERRRANKEARQAAQIAARRRARQQRWAFAIGGLVVAVAVALVLVARLGDDDNTSAADDSTTTASATVSTAAAAAAPCVAVADPLPEGAPEVPVKVGPAPTTLVKEDLVVGTGTEVPAGASVTVNYIGVACSTGKIFDSSYSTGEPATLSLAGVIKGWTDGIPGMKVGGRRLLGIPADQAYGADGRAPTIGPNEALWFVVEVVAVQPG
jgi:peptidylprolyl isomerase